MEINEAKEQLAHQVVAASQLYGKTAMSPEFLKWKRDTEITVERIFGRTGRHLNDLRAIRFSPGSYHQSMPANASEIKCRAGLDQTRAILQSMIEEIGQSGLTTVTSNASNLKLTAATQNSKLIFVSHSSVDKDLADALLDLLCTALHLRFSDFLCTSVDGAKLRGGDNTDDVLRRAIRDVPVFLSLLTKQAISSTYVLFELGARWACEKHHIPLLAKGSGPEVLKEPLKATNALRLSEKTDVLQLVEDLASVLGCHAEPPNSFLKKAEKVVEISRACAVVAKPSAASDEASITAKENKSKHAVDLEAENLELSKNLTLKQELLSAERALQHLKQSP